MFWRVHAWVVGVNSTRTEIVDEAEGVVAITKLITTGSDCHSLSKGSKETRHISSAHHLSTTTGLVLVDP